uniref:Minor capsid protein P11 C-terminal conserved region domain-containing protein n=1 Tax=viral metagenome TaxID=1070528 RepID=A0A6C0HM67_9ZZZZ
MQRPSNNVLICIFVIIILALGVFVYLGWPCWANISIKRNEHFEGGSADAAPSELVQVMSGDSGSQLDSMTVTASESIPLIEQPQGVGQSSGMDMNQLPSECYPKNVLSSADLLPTDANSLYAQVNPSGQGSLADQNFLTAGFHIGINTVGQTLRNANRQLRSEPLNPQVKVSPWLQTTIEPDINRRPLEISSGDL